MEGFAGGVEEKTLHRQILKYASFLKPAFDVLAVNSLTISNQEEIMPGFYHFHDFARQRCVVTRVTLVLIYETITRRSRLSLEALLTLGAGEMGGNVFSWRDVTLPWQMRC